MIGASALPADFHAWPRLDFNASQLTNCYAVPVPWLRVSKASSMPGEAPPSASVRSSGAAAIGRRFGVRHRM
jgi:hypothetical protein